MSYALAAALQAAVYARLAADAPLAALVGAAIYDAAPPRTTEGTYVSLGPGEVSDASDRRGDGATHDSIVPVVSDEAGFALAKEVAAAVSDALSGAGLTLSRGYLVGLWFLRAQARRVDKANRRRIDLTFRARVGA